MYTLCYIIYTYNSFSLGIETLYLCNNVNYPDKIKKNKLVHFIGNILHFCSTSNPIDWLFFEKNNLNDLDFHYIVDYGLRRRLMVSSLQMMSFSGNDNISDKFMPLLLEVIQTQCPKLEWLKLSQTKISDKFCEYLKNFFSENHSKTKLHFIYIDKNKRITNKGISILSDMIQKQFIPKVYSPLFRIFCDNCGFRTRLKNWDDRIITSPNDWEDRGF
ncbi:hypothetical protein RFI_15843 [Reticulomyxa filosa]|uniref:Uncharacterized protein n=1 Tax=Reticulomyxa filosa TaxID=46433 RepID=X6N6H8_RETFI|nr:hypothetical protein RFI_15843 [Reticulomyxa filosa]|eukprot:ETO21359.1 hypothetical protein RFI_15843 [Reticulomyxa filosa]